VRVDQRNVTDDWRGLRNLLVTTQGTLLVLSLTRQERKYLGDLQEKHPGIKRSERGSVVLFFSIFRPKGRWLGGRGKEVNW